MLRELKFRKRNRRNSTASRAVTYTRPTQFWFLAPQMVSWNPPRVILLQSVMWSLNKNKNFKTSSALPLFLKITLGSKKISGKRLQFSLEEESRAGRASRQKKLCDQPPYHPQTPAPCGRAGSHSWWVSQVGTFIFPISLSLCPISQMDLKSQPWKNTHEWLRDGHLIIVGRSRWQYLPLFWLEICHD